MTLRARTQGEKEAYLQGFKAGYKALIDTFVDKMEESTQSLEIRLQLMEEFVEAGRENEVLD